MNPFHRHKYLKIRLLPFYGIFIAVFIILVFGLAYRQLIEGSKYVEQERNQSLRRILQPGTRGNIFDRKGKLLVGNRATFSVVVHLGELKREFEKEYISRVRVFRELHVPMDRNILRKLSRKTVIQHYLDEVNTVIGRNGTISTKELERHFSQRLLFPFPLAKNLTPTEYAKITTHFKPDSPIQIFTDSARYYPFSSAAAHTLGYVSITDDISDENVPGEEITTFSIKGKTGKSGLELQFDRHLQGDSGGKIFKVTPDGTTHQLVEEKQPSQGKDLYTSLDINLQLVAESAFGNYMGAAIAIDVQTGEILALVSKPDYDLNELSPKIPSHVYERINEQGGWLNRATQGMYPPGSPFKLITALALLRNDTVQEDTLCFCDGGLLVGNRNFPCNARYGHGEVDLKTAIAKSCNCYFYEKSLIMGHEKLTEEAKRFELHQPTGIELPYESKRSIVPDKQWKQKRGLSSWTGGDTANMCIGQGYLLVTPLQMATFMASLARNETRTQATILLKTRNDVINHGGRSIGLRKDQMELIFSGLEEATLSGTARLAKIQGLRMGGKTGTAQAPCKGRYINMAWCLSLAPIDDPKIAVCVLIEGTDANDHYHGGSTAGPIARAMLQKYFELYPVNVPSELLKHTAANNAASGN